MIGAFALSSIIVLFLAFHLVKKFTKRPTYSAQRQEEHRKNRELLINNHKAQPITFKTDDGLTLSGFLILRPHAQRNLLLCHGYRMSKERMNTFVDIFSQDNILIFDYRAHGESEGSYTTIGYEEKKDVLAGIKVLQTHECTKNLPMFGIGVSMGAVSLLAAACECPCFKALVLDSPFSRLDEQANRTFVNRYYLPKFPFAMLGKMVFEYIMQFSMADVDAIAWAELINIPVILIHSKQDKVASYSEACKLYEKIKVKKDFWFVPESSHARIIYDFTQEYGNRVNTFFNAVPS